MKGNFCFSFSSLWLFRSLSTHTRHRKHQFPLSSSSIVGSSEYTSTITRGFRCIYSAQSRSVWLARRLRDGSRVHQHWRARPFKKKDDGDKGNELEPSAKSIQFGMGQLLASLWREKMECSFLFFSLPSFFYSLSLLPSVIIFLL